LKIVEEFENRGIFSRVLKLSIQHSNMFLTGSL
jgi:hypothetical protein